MRAATGIVWPFSDIAAIGLTLSSGWVLAYSADHDSRGALLTLASVALMLRTRLDPMWLMLFGAIAGMNGML
ncbi:MAG: hypothetical protein IH606_12780 [Burkholderiales bacterium]|nr:hypothetical protein [Burkholderiales bacterium]